MTSVLSVWFRHLNSSSGVGLPSGCRPRTFSFFGNDPNGLCPVSAPNSGGPFSPSLSQYSEAPLLPAPIQFDYGTVRCRSVSPRGITTLTDYGCRSRRIRTHTELGDERLALPSRDYRDLYGSSPHNSYGRSNRTPRPISVSIRSGCSVRSHTSHRSVFRSFSLLNHWSSLATRCRVSRSRSRFESVASRTGLVHYSHRQHRPKESMTVDTNRPL